LVASLGHLLPAISQANGLAEQGLHFSRPPQCQ
jgi:hypothetical protein